MIKLVHLILHILIVNHRILYNICIQRLINLMTRGIDMKFRGLLTNC